MSLFDATTLLGRLPDPQKYPKTNNTTTSKPAVVNTTTSGGSLSFTGTTTTPPANKGFTGIMTDSFGTSILSTGKGTTPKEAANVVNSTNLWKAEHNKDTNIDLSIQGGSGSQSQRGKQDYVDKVIEKTEKISFIGTETQKNEKAENKVTATTGLSIESTKKPNSNVANNNNVNNNITTTTNNMTFNATTDGNKNTTSGGNNVITNNNISITNTNNIGVVSNNADLISFDDKLNKNSSAGGLSGSNIGGVGGNSGNNTGLGGNNSDNTGGTTGSNTGPGGNSTGLSGALKQGGTGISSTGDVSGGSNLNNNIGGNQGNSTQKINIQSNKPIIETKETFQPTKSTPFDDDVPQLDQSVTINDAVSFNSKIDIGFKKNQNTGAENIESSTNVAKQKTYNEDEFSIYDDDGDFAQGGTTSNNNFIKRGGDLANLQGGKKGNFIINHDVPDYSNIKSKIDTTSKVNKEILVEEDNANAELTKQFQLIQKDKQDKMKAYREMIIKMKNDKRTEQRIKVVFINNFRT
jgi:hypothetical protein